MRLRRLPSWEASPPYIEGYPPACSLPLASPASARARMVALPLAPDSASFVASSWGASSWGLPYRIVGLKGVPELES